MSKAHKKKGLPALGVLGGTFDPVHNGHLIIAEALLEKLSLAQVLFLISARPPHKESSTLAPWRDRLQMVQLALRDNPSFQVSDLEIKRDGPSYTVETMDELQSRYGKHYHVLFVIGADSIREIFAWHEPERLLQSHSLVVVPRPGYDLSQLNPQVAKLVTVVRTPLIEISSSEIRRRVHRGLPIRYLVPEEVANYIERQNLYRL